MRQKTFDRQSKNNRNNDTNANVVHHFTQVGMLKMNS